MVYKGYLNRAAKKKIATDFKHTHLTNKCFYHTDTLLQCRCIPSFVNKVKSSHWRPFGTVEPSAKGPPVQPSPTTNEKQHPSGQGD